jgi:orotate phosphoribosyltransferase
MAMPSRTPVRGTAPLLGPLPDIGVARARLRDIIHRRSFGYGEIKLASGRTSNFYINLKPTMLDAEGAALLAQLTLDALAGERIDYVGGLEMGAVPIAGAVAQLSHMTGAPIQAFFVRKMRETGAEIVFVLALVDREEGATEAFAAQGLDFRAIYRASEFLNR